MSERDDAVAWIDQQLEDGPVIRRLCDIAEAPQVVSDDFEHFFRSGVETGFDFAIDCIDKLYREKGFARPSEIRNILTEWSNNFWVWRSKFRDGDEHEHVWGPDEPLRTLNFDHESWASIRARILRRDRECKRCGDVLQLEVDHIIEVQHGGLPTDDNLRALCKVCHKTKAIWSGTE